MHLARFTRTALLAATAPMALLTAADISVATDSVTIFEAVVVDQFGDPMATQPTVDWTTDIGTLSASIGATVELTAPSTPGTGAVSASSSGFTATRTIEVRELMDPPDLTDGLVAWYRYDGTGGTAVDSSGNGHDASISGSNDREDGYYSGTALTLDGSNQVILEQSVFNDAFTTRTFTTWVQADDLSSSQMIFEAGGSSNGWGIRVQDGQYYAAVLAASQEFGLSADIPSGGWNHLAIRFDNGAFSLFVNGVEQASGTAPFSEVPTHSDDGAIGGINGSDALLSGSEAGFAGSVDDSRFYGRALADSEIETLAGVSSTVRIIYIIDSRASTWEIAPDEGTVTPDPADDGWTFGDLNSLKDYVLSVMADPG